MNYYGARQVDPKANKPDAGKWRFTVRNDNVIWATGPCSTCPGHDTAEEAERHFYDGEIESARYDIEGNRDLRLRCAVCDAETFHGAEFGLIGWNDFVPLCDEHRNRDGLMTAKPFRPGQQIIAS